MKRIFYFVFLSILLTAVCCSNGKSGGNIKKENNGKEKYTELYVVSYLYENGKWDMENGDTTDIYNYEYDEKGCLSKKLILKNEIATMFGDVDMVTKIIYEYKDNIVIEKTYLDAAKDKITSVENRFQDERGRDTLVLKYYGIDEETPGARKKKKYDDIGLLYEFIEDNVHVAERKRIGYKSGELIIQEKSEYEGEISCLTDSIWLNKDNEPVKERRYSEEGLTRESIFENGNIMSVIYFSDGKPERKKIYYYK